MGYKGRSGLQYNLSAKHIAAGGEGKIYDIAGKPNLVAKIYEQGKLSAEKERKLIKMVGFPPQKNVLTQIAWPQDVLYDNAAQFVGFVMPKMKINEDLNVMYEYGTASKYPLMSWKNKISIALNLCAVLDSIHASGHVCGDLNPKNISVDPNSGLVVFLDTDSYHIRDGAHTYRCEVAIPAYLPPEVQVKMRGGLTLATANLPTFSQDTDNFALAIHIFQLLMNGVHPFACAVIPSQASVTAPQPADNILKGQFPFMQHIPGTKIPVYAPKISILPQNMQNLFKRAFIDGHSKPNNRPAPIEWHTALAALRNALKGCAMKPYHQYYNSLTTCPWCKVDKEFAKQCASPSKPAYRPYAQPIVTPPPLPPVPPTPSPTPHVKRSRNFTPHVKRSRNLFPLYALCAAFLAGFIFLSSNKSSSLQQCENFRAGYIAAKGTYFYLNLKEKPFYQLGINKEIIVCQTCKPIISNSGLKWLHVVYSGYNGYIAARCISSTPVYDYKEYLYDDEKRMNDGHDAHLPRKQNNFARSENRPARQFPKTYEERKIIVNTGINRDKTMGSGIYEKEYDSRYSKGALRLDLGPDPIYYQHYKEKIPMK